MLKMLCCKSSIIYNPLRSKRITRILGFAFIALLMMSMGTLLVISIVLYQWEIENVGHSSHLHKFYEYDTTENTATTGFATIKSQLQNNGFISYRSESNIFLITNLDDEGYKCEGTCLCENGQDRRNSFVVSRALITLVGAASSLVAYNLAKERFHEECKTSLYEENICLQSEIKAEVNNCEPVVLYDATKDIENEEDKFEKTKFKCHGTCLSRDFDRDVIENSKIETKTKEEQKEAMDVINQIKVKAKDFQCYQINLEDEVDIDAMGRPEFLKEEREKGTPNRRVAEMLFMDGLLMEHCDKNSLLKVIFSKTPSGDEPTAEPIMIQICLGHNNFENSLVKCI